MTARPMILQEPINHEDWLAYELKSLGLKYPKPITEELNERIIK